jgi:hypothetical protein
MKLVYLVLHDYGEASIDIEVFGSYPKAMAYARKLVQEYKDQDGVTMERHGKIWCFDRFTIQLRKERVR